MNVLLIKWLLVNIKRKRDRNRQLEKILNVLCKLLGARDSKDVFSDVLDRTRRRDMVANAFRQGTR
jgi:hypothetical protein